MQASSVSNLLPSAGQSLTGFSGPYIAGYDAYSEGQPYCSSACEAWQRGWINASEDSRILNRLTDDLPSSEISIGDEIELTPAIKLVSVGSDFSSFTIERVGC